MIDVDPQDPARMKLYVTLMVVFFMAAVMARTGKDVLEVDSDDGRSSHLQEHAELDPRGDALDQSNRWRSNNG